MDQTLLKYSRLVFQQVQQDRQDQLERLGLLGLLARLAQTVVMEPLGRQERLGRQEPLVRRLGSEHLLLRLDLLVSQQADPTLLRSSHSVFLKEPLDLLVLTEATVRRLGLEHLLHPQDQSV